MLQRAARFYFLQKCAFGSRIVGRTFGTVTTGGPRLNLLRIEEELGEGASYAGRGAFYQLK